VLSWEVPQEVRTFSDRCRHEFDHDIFEIGMDEQRLHSLRVMKCSSRPCLHYFPAWREKRRLPFFICYRHREEKLFVHPPTFHFHDPMTNSTIVIEGCLSD
jgi:hypothetical protein